MQQVQAAAAQKFNADEYIRANQRKIYGWISRMSYNADLDEIFGDACLRLFLQQDDFDGAHIGKSGKATSQHAFAKRIVWSAAHAYFKATNRRNSVISLVDFEADETAPEADVAVRGGDFDGDDCDVDMSQRVENFDLELRKELRIQSPALVLAYDAIGGLQGLGMSREDRAAVPGYAEQTLRKHIASIKKIVLLVWPAHFEAELPFSMRVVKTKAVVAVVAVDAVEVAPVEAAEVAVATPVATPVAANDAAVTAPAATLPAAAVASAVQLDLFASAPAPVGQLELFPSATVRSLAEQRALRKAMQAAAVASACSRAAPIADGGAPALATVYSLDVRRRRKAAETAARAENLLLFAPPPGVAEPPGAVVEPARLVRTA